MLNMEQSTESTSADYVSSSKYVLHGQKAARMNLLPVKRRKCCVKMLMQILRKTKKYTPRAMEI